MLSSATNSVIRKWSQRWFPNVRKNPPPLALHMHLLLAFVHSTDICYSSLTIERTQRYVTSTYTFVVWMLDERHVYFGMSTNEFRMEIVWKVHYNWMLAGNWTKTRLWMSCRCRRAPCVSHGLSGKKKCRKYQSNRTECQSNCRGQIQLEISMEGPIVAGICTKTRSRLSSIRRQAPCKRCVGTRWL